MVKEAPKPYKFICSRRDANRVRDQLWKITTGTYTHVWFSIQDDPLEYLYDPTAHRTEPLNKIKEYSMSCYFGSMASYDTFIIHSDPYPGMQDLCITRLKREPDTIRIVSRVQSRQMIIPLKWLQNQILVKTKHPPCVILMLKHSVIMKKASSNSGFCSYER